MSVELTTVLSGPSGPAGQSWGWDAKSASFTAEANKAYIILASATVTDPATPTDGTTYELFVRAGTTTVDGENHTAGTRVFRTYFSGAWETYVSSYTT